jgi:hypothetical protein
MAATRTDIHRPGSPEFNPGDYRCRGVFDLEEAHSIVVRTTLVAALVGAGYSFTDVMVVTVTDGPAAGWIVDGTLPSSLDPGFGSLEEFEGKRVRFAATLKPASGPGYAWFSRPTKAAYVD